MTPLDHCWRTVSVFFFVRVCVCGVITSLLFYVFFLFQFTFLCLCVCLYSSKPCAECCWRGWTRCACEGLCLVHRCAVWCAGTVSWKAHGLLTALLLPVKHKSSPMCEWREAAGPRPRREKRIQSDCRQVERHETRLKSSCVLFLQNINWRHLKSNKSCPHFIIENHQSDLFMSLGDMSVSPHFKCVNSPPCLSASSDLDPSPQTLHVFALASSDLIHLRWLWLFFCLCFHRFLSRLTGQWMCFLSWVSVHARTHTVGLLHRF